jgi:hypothetical protein
VERDQSARRADFLLPGGVGRILVDVHQVVRDLAGAVLVDEHVGHRLPLSTA